jgi:hypothetical protein
LGICVPSIERLARMVAEDGHLVVNAKGIWQKHADGSPLQFTDSIGRKFSPPLLRADFDAWRRAKLVSRDLSAPAEQGIVFAPTPAGFEVGAKASGRHRLRKAAVR